MTDTWDAETLAALSPAHVGGYLRAHNWRDQGPYGEFGRLFEQDIGGRGFEVVLPTRSTITDFARRMSELVNDLAMAENRPPTAVLFDLTLTPFDVIRLRARDADGYGSIKLSQGIELHKEGQNLLVAAARAALADAPKKAWKGRRPETIDEYISRVRLGQTEKSSYSLTILSPYAFDPSNHAQSLFDEEAFGRRVTIQFAKALGAIELALAEAVSSGVSAFESRVGDGVSANLCQSLAKLADSDEGTEASITWSPAKPYCRPARLSLTRQDAAVLHEVARKFAQEEPELDAELEGVITEIKDEPRTFDGSAVIEAIVEGRLRRVRIVGFEDSERDRLIDAFRDRRRVRVEGELTLDKKQMKLTNPRGLVLLSQPDSGE